MLLAALLISALELQNIEFTNNHFGHLTSDKINSELRYRKETQEIAYKFNFFQLEYKWAL